MLDTGAFSPFHLIFPVPPSQTPGSIGKRYRRQDEIGTPLCVTIDFQTLEDRAVTIRDRDSMEQVRVPIEELVARLRDMLKLGGV